MESKKTEIKQKRVVLNLEFEQVQDLMNFLYLDGVARRAEFQYYELATKLHARLEKTLLKHMNEIVKSRTDKPIQEDEVADKAMEMAEQKYKEGFETREDRQAAGLDGIKYEDMIETDHVKPEIKSDYVEKSYGIK
jgi:hypothetical protein